MAEIPRSDSDHEVPVDTFIPFMRDVVRCENSLRELNLMWRLIEASAKMNCPEEAHTLLPMMAATREGFQRLEGDLVQSLVAESLGEVMAEIGTSAHHVIDIVVRNLYERTADVGFLATDQDLCRFVAGQSDGVGVLDRLREYRNKYTVYDEIMLIDLQGTVLAQIDENSPVEGSDDPLIAATLQSHGYVETFRNSALRPRKPHALMYSHRMLHPDTGHPVGVLCLGFDFEGEMRGIFKARGDGAARSIALLLDAEQRVLASSDMHWIGVGERVPVNHTGAPVLRIHSGRTYLVQTVQAAGYQGYPGPSGWTGQVMIPIEQAFAAKGSRAIDALDPAVAQGLLAHARNFCPPLYEIVTAADTIRRVVWNGQVMTAGQRGTAQKLKAVLEQIGETGARTNEVFTQSIRDLYDTVLGSSMRDSELLTHLMVDLLDRNLYERANDCRWWALTPQLRLLLADEMAELATEPDRAQACSILEHINHLYTVYARIVVYDRQGCIVAASHSQLPGGSSVLGLMVEADTLQAVLRLHTTQHYHVTPWRTCAYGAGAVNGALEPGYVYHAAIRAPADETHIVGGIGVVFNTVGELQAMLQGGVDTKTQTIAVYAQRDGTVLASSHPNYHAVGSRLELPQSLLEVPNGQSQSQAMVYQGHYCIVGCAASHGYREFKVSDGYEEEVLALSFESFGEVQEDALAAVKRSSTVLQSSGQPTGGREMATFFVGASLFALDAEYVLEALPASAVAPVSAGRLPYCIGTLARRNHGSVTGYVWVFDLGHVLTGKPSRMTAQSQVVVVQCAGRRIGLLVSELQGVNAFAQESIVTTPGWGGAAGALVAELIRANQGALLVQCLSPVALLEVLQAQAQGKRIYSADLAADPSASGNLLEDIGA